MNFETLMKRNKENKIVRLDSGSYSRYGFSSSHVHNAEL